jgi:carboxyl-terminal processing protease
MKLCLLVFLLLANCSNPYQNLHDSLDEALTIIDELYPEKPDQERLRQSMLNGLIQGIDTHGSYLSEAQIKSLTENIEGGELKLGMLISKHKDGLQVKKVFEQSAGYAVGIKEGDLLTEFDGTSLKDVQLDEFLSLMKDKKSYVVTLLRNKNKITTEITPSHFTVPTAEREWFGNVAYLKFGCIGKEAADEVQSHLQIIKARKKLKGLILDFRDCPGGSFDAGIGIASQFLDGDVIVEMQRKQSFSKFSSKRSDTLNKLPLVVLQNKNTCSAAEIIIAALKAHKRAILIGENTAGSATAKAIVSFANHKDGLILTIAFLNDPFGKRIGKNGVEPDILKTEIKIPKNKKSDPYIAEALKFLQ